ncbi:MAG: glycoside hydrolase family 5 protein [Ruminococcus sp.]|nr:glycoside hydrolase family 5 protein [Ruminococcus sp.]
MLKEMEFYRGINFGGWLSQCDYSEERLNGFIKEEDFKTVASWGLDHVRIPIDYNILEDNVGGYKESGFALVEKAVMTAKKYGLNTVIDIHKTAGFSFDDYSEDEHGFFESEALQERFYRLWEEIAKRFGKMNSHTAFELLNEVTDQSYITVWNKVVKECIGRIRKYAPDTVILVGSYWNNSADAVKDLDKPFDDKVVYNFHCYSPMEFTHQGAPWATHMIDIEKRFSFEECGITEEYFEKAFSSALEKAKQEGVEVYCGEYGVIDIVSPEDTLKWFKVINAVFEKHNISRSAWSYKQMDFGISDERLDGVRDELVKYL